MIAQLSSFFGLLALLLAAIGLYGVMAYNVLRRTNEIGIRMDIGAAKGDVLWMVLRESLAMVALGIALGVPTALRLERLVANHSCSLFRPATPPLWRWPRCYWWPPPSSPLTFRPGGQPRWTRSWP